METSCDYLIRTLNLTVHPEGGYFKESYRSSDRIEAAALPDRYQAERPCSAAIYFLLPGDQVSKFHRLQCDEIWCHHSGESLTLYVIDASASLLRIKLGPRIDEGEQPQIFIPHNVWFGAKVNKKNAYSLVTCITAPGFDFDDFELARRQGLLQCYPQHREIIEMLT
ncbi:MAG: cupin domain-containing protein [bacterium]|nr:cupin domain-containing protein [bacterium]